MQECTCALPDDLFPLTHILRDSATLRGKPNACEVPPPQTRPHSCSPKPLRSSLCCALAFSSLYYLSHLCSKQEPEPE